MGFGVTLKDKLRGGKGEQPGVRRLRRCGGCRSGYVGFRVAERDVGAGEGEGALR